MVRIGGGGAPLGAIIPDGIRGRGLLRTILDHKLFAGGRSGLPKFRKDLITLMSGSLSDMNLKYEIDGIDSLKAPQLNMRLKLTIKLV